MLISENSGWFLVGQARKRTRCVRGVTVDRARMPSTLAGFLFRSLGADISQQMSIGPMLVARGEPGAMAHVELIQENREINGEARPSEMAAPAEVDPAEVDPLVAAAWEPSPAIESAPADLGRKPHP